MQNKGKDLALTPALTSVGALVGIGYAVSKKHSFWITAGSCIVFAIIGFGTGKLIESVNP
jgi:hypothetical protein